ncbi:uncharacterized protein [Triticum aestivum]|uniref:uncharacterized protein n=1 Tax=Triticum aestivum TaxID=4565 RepID=UPI001D01400F|nr:uncharacterized protein LOC123091844 [Triticum aestivum]
MGVPVLCSNSPPLPMEQYGHGGAAVLLAHITAISVGASVRCGWMSSPPTIVLACSLVARGSWSDLQCSAIRPSALQFASRCVDPSKINCTPSTTIFGASRSRDPTSRPRICRPPCGHPFRRRVAPPRRPAAPSPLVAGAVHMHPHPTKILVAVPWAHMCSACGLDIQCTGVTGLHFRDQIVDLFLKSHINVICMCLYYMDYKEQHCKQHCSPVL